MLPRLLSLSSVWKRGMGVLRVVIGSMLPETLADILDDPIPKQQLATTALPTSFSIHTPLPIQIAPPLALLSPSLSPAIRLSAPLARAHCSIPVHGVWPYAHLRIFRNTARSILSPTNSQSHYSSSGFSYSALHPGYPRFRPLPSLHKCTLGPGCARTCLARWGIGACLATLGQLAQTNPIVQKFSKANEASKRCTHGF